MNAIQLGNPNLFVKGMVEARIYDPATGNIIGYDNVASESAVTSTVNMGEVVGGIGNVLLMNIPDTTRITGSLTSQAFSLNARALASGGEVIYGGTAPVCETITASGAALTVTQQPVLSYGQAASETTGWCYVREHGATTFMGTNYGVDLTTKQVQGFTAVEGTQYDVFYFVENASAQVLALPEAFNPKVATIHLKYAVYAKQNNSVSNGTLQGYLYFIVPRAQFVGDTGINANQTTNATSNYDWQAVSSESGVMRCDDCAGAGADYAYYIYVPCAGSTSAVEALAVIGGGVSVAQGATAQIPVVFVMPDNSIQTPDYTLMNYASDNEAVTVSASGVVTGASAGSAVVTISLKSNAEITTTANVTVTASA